MSCKHPPQVIIRRRTKRPTNVVYWRTVRRTEKFPEECDTCFSGDETRTRMIIQWIGGPLGSIMIGCIRRAFTHISASNRKRNAGRKTYEAR